MLIISGRKHEEPKTGTTDGKGDPKQLHFFPALSDFLSPEMVTISLSTCLDLEGWVRGAFRSGKTASNN